MHFTGTARILIADPGSNRREVLFTFPGFVYHTVPSPTGKFVAFVGNVRGENHKDERHLFLYDIDRGAYADVSSPGYYSRAVLTAPIFSPDGSKVFFISRWSTESGEFNVFVCEVADRKTGGFYTEPVEDTPLTLTPDGKEVVAVRRIANRPGTLEYVAINIDDNTARSLHRFDSVTKLGPAYFDFSGATLFCDLKPFDIGSETSMSARGRLVESINLETGEEKTLLDPNSVTYLYQVFTDSQGKLRLLLRRQEESENEETPLTRIATMLSDGSDFKYLTTTEAKSYFLRPPNNIPHVSPDNRLLFFYRRDPVFEHEDIWVMKPDGSDPVNISNTAGYAEGSAGWLVIR
ncbi:MAG: hypothetical protein ABIC40_03995, partial [bacterium]